MSRELGNPVIELKSVTTSSGGYEILKNVSVSFFEGFATAVLGSAGSGKSALLKTAAGLAVPESGSVLFRGSPMESFSADDERFFRSRTSFAFQDAALWANQSIFNNIALPLRVHKPWMENAEIRERVREVLSRVGYEESVNSRPAELSSGEQKLVSIARALVLNPELVFLDDPATGLDEDAKDRVYGVLESLRSAGKSILLVTGDMSLVHSVADYIVIIREGKIVAAGLYDDIVASEAPEAAGLVARLRARGARTRGAPRPVSSPTNLERSGSEPPRTPENSTDPPASEEKNA